MARSDDMADECRLLVDGRSGGAWQMAVDETILETAASGGGSTLRFYEWSEPTLSLGYFQGYEERLGHRHSRNAAVVRRQTGGGAILHDRELTYSLAMNVAHPLAKDASRLYDVVHLALRQSLARVGVVVRKWTGPAKPGPTQSEPEPFLCFQRRSPGDVVIGKDKVCGSAQRRRRGAVLQHGSLLLGQSPLAPELPGIEELSGKKLHQVEFMALWQRELEEGLDLKLAPRELTAAERQSVTCLALEKYDARAWTRRR